MLWSKFVHRCCLYRDKKTPNKKVGVFQCPRNIHPFADGNGRTGRLAMNYFLVLHNHPPVIIHEEDRKQYYEGLEAWDIRQDLEPMLAFLQEQTVKTWEKQMKRTKNKRKN